MSTENLNSTQAWHARAEQAVDAASAVLSKAASLDESAILQVGAERQTMDGQEQRADKVLQLEQPEH